MINLQTQFNKLLRKQVKSEVKETTKIDSLYIKGILAYLNEFKKHTTKIKLKEAIRVANNIPNIDVYFLLNDNLEIEYKQY